MENNNLLFKTLITKITGFPEKSYENRQELKKSQALLRQFHPLEINPKYIEREIEQLCEKLEIHSLDYKAVAVKNIYKKLLGFCNSKIDYDHYLLMNGIILFLLEIGGSMVNSYEYEEIIERNEVLSKEEINWKEILTQSEDILSLTREDYSLDDLSEYSTDIEDESESDTVNVNTNSDQILHNTSLIDYSCIPSNNWNIKELKDACESNLQSEYWFDNYQTKYVSSTMRYNSKRNFSTFVDDWEKFIENVFPDYYSSEYKNRIEITEYQLIRELIDLLMGSSQSSLVKVEIDLKSISKNRCVPLKSVKLINLTWKSLDNIIEQFIETVNNCLQLRRVCSYIIRDHFSVPFPPSIAAFAERLHYHINEFDSFLLELERKSRGGNLGLSILDLLKVVVNDWSGRIRFLNQLVIEISCNRFDSFHCNSTVISLLDLLFKMINETRLVLIDQWMIESIIALFYRSVQPYLYSLDALLSGQSHRNNRSENMFLVSCDSSRFFDRSIGIASYWNDHFTFRQQQATTGNGNNNKLLDNIPVLLQPFIVELISTIKSIDLLHVLSTEFTRPAIVNPIIIEPGNFIDNFNPNSNGKSIIGKPTDEVLLFRYQMKSDFVLPEHHVVLNRISNGIIDNLTIVHRKSITNQLESDNNNTQQPLADCGYLYGNLFLNISDRYRSVNSHLISVFIDLGLKSALTAIKSIYFFQADWEMHEFCSHVFDILFDSNSNSIDCADFSLDINLKFQQILSESSNADLKSESDRFSIRFRQQTEISSDHSRSILSDALLPRISIDYRIKWMLKILITDQIISSCEKCFQFLLNLKFAKFCLELKIHLERNQNRHRFSDLENRICSLRLKLLQIINQFHAYIMRSFVLPSWAELMSIIDYRQKSREFIDFTDFIFRVSQPFNTMLRGCLQSPEMTTVEKAINNIIVLGIEAARIDSPLTNRVVVKRLEQKYTQLIDFISAMFRSLSHLGVSISELDISAFQ